METQLDKRIVEAILFAVGKYISEKNIAKLMNLEDSKTIHETLIQLQKDYHRRDGPLMIMNEKDNWKLTVREEFIGIVQKIIPNTELTKTVMETLAVVAWKAPIKQSVLVEIRSNKAYDHIQELIEKDFITKERHSRTYIIKLTKKFYDYFDIKGKEDIKQIFKDFEDDEELQKELQEFERRAEPDHVGSLEVYDIIEGPKSLDNFKKDEVTIVSIKPKTKFEEEIKKELSTTLETFDNKKTTKSTENKDLKESEKDKPQSSQKSSKKEVKNLKEKEDLGKNQDAKIIEEKNINTENDKENVSENESEDIKKIIKKKKEIDADIPNLDDVMDEDSQTNDKEKENEE